MRLKRTRATTGGSPELLEALEPRQFLALATHTQIVASTAQTIMGQAVTYSATVTPNFGTGIPIGFVNFKDGATVLATVPLDANGRASFSTYSLFMGSHTIIARFTGSGVYNASASSTGLTVSQGSVTTGSDGLQTATVVAGTGVGAATGRNIMMNYTGYLTDGTKFDSSLNTQRSPFTITLGTTSLITGFTEGMNGIKVGETRLLVIPPALGYGAQGQGSIPANATLYFIIQVLSFPNRAKPLTLTGSNAGPVLSTAPAATQNGTDFGVIQNRTTSTATTVIISDSNPNFFFSGTKSITITGANPFQFAISQPTMQTSGIWTFAIAFSPTSVGSKRATVVFTSNDPNFPKFEIRLAGTSV